MPEPSARTARYVRGSCSIFVMPVMWGTGRSRARGSRARRDRTGRTRPRTRRSRTSGGADELDDGRPQIARWVPRLGDPPRRSCRRRLRAYLAHFVPTTMLSVDFTRSAPTTPTHCRRPARARPEGDDLVLGERHHLHAVLLQHVVTAVRPTARRPHDQTVLELALYCAVAWPAAPLKATSAQTAMRRSASWGSLGSADGVGWVAHSTRSEAGSKNGHAGSPGKNSSPRGRADVRSALLRSVTQNQAADVPQRMARALLIGTDPG